MAKRRVVITGLGVIAPNGIGKEKFWENIKNGKSGIKKITSFDTEIFPCKIAGEVTDFDPLNFLNTKEIKHMARFTQFSIAASKMAIEDAALDLGNENREKIGVVIGSSVGGLSYALEEIDIFKKRG